MSVRAVVPLNRPIRFVRGAEAVTPAQLADLYRAVGWRRGPEEAGPEDLARLGRLIAGSSLVASVWDGLLLVGFARCLTDGAFIGYVNNVAVRPQYWRRGLGRRLVEMLTTSYPEVLFMVSAGGDVVPFFERLGFKAYQTAWMARDPREE
ncbi:MAG TPA: GNAT family N-acetyltransferase [Bacillota bacterium]|jgi:ribosomal protein S18 acetylase RimI-like enzyme